MPTTESKKEKYRERDKQNKHAYDQVTAKWARGENTEAKEKHDTDHASARKKMLKITDE